MLGTLAWSATNASAHDAMTFTMASIGGRLSPGKLRLGERLAHTAASSGAPRRNIGSTSATTIASYDATTHHDIPAVFWCYIASSRLIGSMPSVI